MAAMYKSRATSLNSLIMASVAVVLFSAELTTGQGYADTIPGLAGEDYPIFAVEVPTSFICDGLEPGYYADPEAECQQYHICASDGTSGLLKYSFLCPNGTLFNQQYFICDWWFNVDCSQAENFYFLNSQINEAAALATENSRNREGRSQGLRAKADIAIPERAPVVSSPSSPGFPIQEPVVSRRGPQRGGRFSPSSFAQGPGK